MRNKLIVIFTLLTLTSCSNQKDAKHALTALGFTDIKITGYAWRACSKEDFYHTGFIAKSVKGQIVKGAVCSGFFFKNSYVRFK